MLGYHSVARRTNSSADNSCTDSSTSADSGAAADPDDSTSHACTCSSLLQVGKQLRRKLCKWVVQLEPVKLRWLWWDLVRTDTA